jgi:peptidoglycan/xylan/chitin deacetylase (PgdA/CDA1 family)
MSSRNALAVMYHYVRPAGEDCPDGIRPLRTDEFELQLDWLQHRYRVLPPDGFLDAIAAGWRPAEPPPCLLTFDDGTRDHLEVAMPILERRGLSGVFFVITWPAEQGRMPLSHALHWALGLSDEVVWGRLVDRAGGESELGTPEDAERVYSYESPLRARVKYAANIALPENVTAEIIAELARENGTSLDHLAREWFLSADQVRELRGRGMTIGVHGRSHRSLQALGAEGIRSEIEHAVAYLEGLLGQRPTWFSCPFGGSGTDPELVSAMRAAARRAGIRAAVTTEKTTIAPGCDPMRLPRFDTIDLPPRRVRTEL